MRLSSVKPSSDVTGRILAMNIDTQISTCCMVPHTQILFLLYGTTHSDTVLLYVKSAHAMLLYCCPLFTQGFCQCRLWPQWVSRVWDLPTAFILWRGTLSVVVSVHWSWSLSLLFPLKDLERVCAGQQFIAPVHLVADHSTNGHEPLIKKPRTA